MRNIIFLVYKDVKKTKKCHPGGMAKRMATKATGREMAEIASGLI